MSRYVKNETLSPRGDVDVSIVVESSGCVTFPAEVGNPNYDAFLVQAELTDTQVKALKPDTWYDFPKETK